VKNLRLKRRRDIGRQRWQFVAVLVTVVLGVMMFAASYNAFLILGASLEGSYERLAMADMVVNNPDGGLADTVGSIPGVAAVIERRQTDIPMAMADRTLLGRLIGMPADGQPAINKLDIVDGTYLDPADRTAVVLEQHAAVDFGLEVGDTFEIAGAEVTVAGVAVSPEYLWPAKDGQNLFTPPKTFAVVFIDEAILAAAPDAAATDQVLVLYETDADTAEVDTAVIDAAETANASHSQPLVDQPSNATINLEISGLRIFAIAFPLLFLAAAGMAIYVVITRMVFSQRGVIGTLRATGFSSRALSKHYRSYGVGVGLVGAVIGVVLGSLLARLMTFIYTKVFGIPDLVAEFHVPTIIMALLFGVTAGALAAVPPARAVARMAPAEAMRGDAPAHGGKRSLFEKLVPPLRDAPVRWRMTLRGIGRSKRRSLSMVIGVVLSMTLILAAWGMIDTMLQAFDRQFNEVAIEDVTVAFGVAVGTEQVNSIEAVAGVAVAEPVIGLKATVRHGGESYATLLEGYQNPTRVHGFPDGQPASGALLGKALEDVLKVGVGDAIGIEFPSLGVEVETTVAGFVDEPLGTFAYVEAEALTSLVAATNSSITAEVLALPSMTTVKAIYEDEADPAAMLGQIQEVDGVAAAIDATELRALLEEFQVFFYVFLGMMLLFGGAMAFALIFNIITVNVAERSGEFASMRANGLTNRKVASLISGETFLLVAIGIIPGLIVGYVAAAAFMSTFSSPEFPITLNMRPLSYIGAAAAMFIVAGLSLIPAIRSVRRINIGEVVRERAV